VLWLAGQGSTPAFARRSRSKSNERRERCANRSHSDDHCSPRIRRRARVPTPQEQAIVGDRARRSYHRPTAVARLSSFAFPGLPTRFGEGQWGACRDRNTRAAPRLLEREPDTTVLDELAPSSARAGVTGTASLRQVRTPTALSDPPTRLTATSDRRP